MDPEIKRELLRQKAARIEMVKKEMAWEAAKHDLALRKLQSRSGSSTYSFDVFEKSFVKFFLCLHFRVWNFIWLQRCSK
jgi:hypothetical protein